MDKRLLTAFTIYLTALFASNTLGMKLMPFVFGAHLSTAIFAFPLVFLMTDVVGEVYGRETARSFVRMGFWALLIYLGFNLLSNLMPASPDFRQLGAYNEVFGLSFRFTLASLAAFIIGEYQDVLTFFLIRAKIGGRWFALRSFLSNLWGQLLDSAIWFTIAFAGVYPPAMILKIMLPWWLFKVAMGLAYTPLCYLGIRLLRGGAPGFPAQAAPSAAAGLAPPS